MLCKSLCSRWLLASASVLFLACSGEDEEPLPAPPAAALIIDRASVDFGEVEVGASSDEHLFTIRNASPVAVESVNVTVDNDAFVIAASTCERFLDAGRECQVRVKFTPRLAGSHTVRLQTQGAPEGDHAVLTGRAVAFVEVRGLAAGTSVVAGADEWSCGTPCRVPVRTAEVTLRATPVGFPRWGGACSTAARECTLRMDGSKVVSLEEVAPVLQWELPWPSHLREVAVAPGGDLVIRDDYDVTRLSGTGQARWRLQFLNPRDMGLDGQGNTYVLSSSGRVTGFSVEGRELWSFLPEGERLWGDRIAVAPDGNVYFVVAVDIQQSSRHFKLYALSPQGTERWSHTFNEGPINILAGLGMDAQGALYLSGNVYRSDGTPTGYITEKRYFRKFSPEGAQLWEQRESWYDFVVSPEGVTSVTSNVGGSAPGGFSLSLLEPNGTLRLTAPVNREAGVVDTQGFLPSGGLLVGGHQERASGPIIDKGWFAVMNLETRALGPITYIDGPPDVGARVNALALTFAGGLVVGGGFGPQYGGGKGFLRVYDARVLTVDLDP